MRTCAVFLALLLLAIPRQDPTNEVDRICDQIRAQPVEELGTWAHRLAELGRPAAPAIRAKLSDADPKVRLAAAFVVYQQGFRDEAITVYRRLLEDSNPAIVRMAASAMAAQAGDDPEVTAERLRELAAAVRRQIAAAGDELTRVGLWQAVMRLDPSAEPPRNILEIFRRNRDKQVRDAAALALAEMDAFHEVRSHLAQLAREPTPQGRMAAAHLKIMRLQDDLLRRTPPRYDLTQLEQALDILRENYVDPAEIDVSELLKRALQGLCSGLDRYTAYYDEQAIRALREEELEGRYGGIGARVAMTKDRAGVSWLTITEPIFSGPAYEAGIRSGDRITEVEGESTANKDLQYLVNKLRGRPGTPVTIKVYSRRWREVREFTLAREEIHLETTHGRMMPGSIGYIRLDTFGEQNVGQMRAAVEQLNRDGMRALVLDLRGNSGGYLGAAVPIVDLFLPPGLVIVTSRGREGVERPMVYRSRQAALTEVPMVILVDGSSASASEILAGALRDHNRAVLVGTRTFGKGSIQRLIPLPASGGASAVRVTTARWHLPSDQSVEGGGDSPGGIEPSIQCLPAERDLWLEAEAERFRVEGQLDRYIRERFERFADRFRQLADWDGANPDAYPDFDELYASLNTKASRDQIRELLRETLRSFVADDRGSPWIMDYQTDRQLQWAILEACRLAGIDPHSIDRYEAIARAFEERPPPPRQPEQPED